MDFITNLPVTADGLDSILTIVDRFYKLLILIPCRISISAVEVAQLVFNEVICKYGTPENIISDRDVRF